MEEQFQKICKEQQNCDSAKPHKSYVYYILDHEQIVCYVGQTKNLKNRLMQHNQSLKNLNCNRNLYTYLRENGKNQINTLWVIEEYIDITQDQLRQKEQYWIDYYDQKRKLQNQAKSYKKNSCLTQQQHAIKKEKFICECSGKYTRSGKSHHIKTIKHQLFLLIKKIPD